MSGHGSRRPLTNRSYIVFSIRKSLRSFIHAGRGLGAFLLVEQNARIHAVAMVLVIAAGVHFRIHRWEWIAVALACGLVLASEALNTAIEQLCDMVRPERDPRVKMIKDLAAASVLLSALAALVVGVLVFAPRISNALGFAPAG